MANISYNDINTNDNSERNFKVSYFNLKDGEEAIVRFVIDSIADFELFTVHPITVGQSSYPNRKVSCLRNNPKTDPIHMCPLCAKGEKVQQRMYIKMLQYVNENGRIVPKAVVWDRPAFSYAPQIKSYLDNYGQLTNIICKIVRHGTGLDTKYDIVPNLNPQMYSEQIYVKDFSDFADFSILGRMVMNKSFEEINQFILTGSFPTPATETANVTSSSTTSIPMNSNLNPTSPPMPTEYWANGNSPDTAQNTTVPQMSRPVRYY